MTARPRLYAISLIAVGFILFVAVALANVLIDPQEVFGTGLVAGQTNPNQRYARYEAYKRHAAEVDGLFFSSSRGHAISLDDLSARTGATFAGFTVAFGLVTDHLPVLEHIVREKAARGQRIKDVFLLLDTDFLGQQPQTNRSIQGYLHPDVSGEEPARFWLRSLTSIQFKSWREDLRRHWQTAPAPAEQVMPPAPAPINRPVAGAAITTSAASIPLRRVTHFGDYARQIALLKRFAEVCRDNGIRLTVATSPLRRINAERFDPDDLAAAVAQISRFMPLWDFGAPPWLSARADLWRDVSHFNPEVGAMILARIYDGATPPGVASFGELKDGRRPGVAAMKP